MSLFWLRADQAERNARMLSTDHLASSLGRRTAPGGVLAIGSQVARTVLQLAQAAIMARLLAPEDFGLIAMAMTVTGFVSLFTDLGLSPATVQHKDIDQDTVIALFCMNIAMSLIVMLAYCAAAPLAGWFFRDDRVTLLVICMAATIPIGAAGAQHNALLTRNMRWSDLQWTQILVQLAGMVSGIVLAWKTDLGYWALVFASWVGALAGLVLVWAVCPWRPSWVRDWAGARGSLNFGAYLTGFNLINYFHRQFDNVLVGWRCGAVELGFYSRACTLLTMPLPSLTDL